MREPKTGQKRKAIEAVMQTATSEAPLSAKQIAERSGVEVTNARCHIGNILGERLAYNLHPAQRDKALYVWGQPAKAEPLPQLRNMLSDDSPPFVPPAMRCTRPEGNRAFEIPSLGDSERKRPALIGAKALQAVGVHGGKA